MVSRRLLSGMLVFALHFSLCIGMALSAPKAFAATGAFSGEGTTGDDVLLSAVGEARSACMTTQGQHVENAVHIVTHGACADGEACLRQSHTNNLERLSAIYTPAERVVSPVYVATLQDVYYVPLPQRTGPLYEDAVLTARSLVKRE